MPPSATATTEITLSTGERYTVKGDAREIERLILDAARGSLMQFAWLTDSHSESELGINPDAVLLLRASPSS